MVLKSRELISKIITVWLLVTKTSAFYDSGTTTAAFIRTDTMPRQSFFRWQRTEFDALQMWFGYWDWDDLHQRRKLCLVAGVSIDFLTIGVATILNRRTLITSDNILDAFMNRQRDLRVWALGRNGMFNTPFRYRVWRVTRIFPRSLNDEHWHGPRGVHQPRHDVTLITTLDQMYLYSSYPTRYMYPYRATLVGKHDILLSEEHGPRLWFAGSGFEYPEHIYENYKITYAYVYRTNVVDCSKYLPKYWGKFICILNAKGISGVQTGGGLFLDTVIAGLGCFEIRYNEHRILVFTDLRYYVDYINLKAYITPGEYYEYAYPQWGEELGFWYDGNYNYPYVPVWQIVDDMYPLGKKK